MRPRQDTHSAGANDGGFTSPLPWVLTLVCTVAAAVLPATGTTPEPDLPQLYKMTHATSICGLNRSGSWGWVRTASVLEGSDLSERRLGSTNALQTSSGLTRPSLVVTCASGEPEVRLETCAAISPGTKLEVQFDQNVIRVPVSVSDDGTSIRFKHSDHILEQILESRELQVTLTPISKQLAPAEKQPQSVMFRLGVARSPLGRAIRDCGKNTRDKSASPVSSSPLIAGVGGVTEPELLNRIGPIYPELARRARIVGKVILRCVIAADGGVHSCEVLKSPPGSLGFDEASLTAVEQWRYKPATIDGKPVDVYFTVVMNFALDDE